MTTETQSGIQPASASTGRFVVVAYSVKPAKVEGLGAAVDEHLHVLRAESWVTDAPASARRAADGAVVEFFKARFSEAIACR